MTERASRLNDRIRAAAVLSMLLLYACGPADGDRSEDTLGNRSANAVTSAEPGGPPSPSPDIDPDRITVAGLSAGGIMAHQLHVAYPELFSGAAAIAGGPYGCAAGSLATAMARCMGAAGELPVDEFAAMLRKDAEAGRLGDPAELADDRAWLFHGTADTVVAAGVSDALAKLYALYLPEANIRYVDDIAAAHHFPAAGQGHACDASRPPFVGNCGYDAAGQLLQFLYPGLEPPPDDITPGDLAEFPLPGGAEAGLAETAYLYAPAACEGATAGCALHVVLHGCAQAASQVGTAFIEQSGYLPWAETNGIVLAFPQVVPGAANPYACWDWWGYTGAGYRWREGAQMRVIANWVSRLSGLPSS